MNKYCQAYHFRQPKQAGVCGLNSIPYGLYIFQLLAAN